MRCYRCQKALSPSDRNCPSCGQAVYTTASSSNPSYGRRLGGWIPDRPSPRDFQATPNLATLPRLVDLRDHCTAVEDQGQIGSCVANAAVGAMEYQRAKAGEPAVDLSRLFVYFNGRRMAGRQDQDCGMTISEGMAAFLAYGAPSEKAWPYDPNLLMREPDPTAYEEARSYVPNEYARVNGSDHVKGALAQGFPVVFGISLPSRCYEEAGRTGTMPIPSGGEIDAAKRECGHAMLLVGYDLDAGVFIVRNSWGPQWGTKGYCRLSMDVFQSAVNDSWILGKLDANGAFKVHRPLPTAAPVEGSVKGMAAKMRDEIRDGLTKDIKDSFKDIKDRLNPRR